MRIIRITATYLSILFLSFVSLSIIAFHVFQRDLSNVVLSALKPMLQAEVKVRSLQASLFAAFPQGSVELIDVRIADTDPESPENAYEIGRLYLLFDYKDLWKGNLRIRHIIVRDAAIAMRYRADGSANFEFWQRDDSAGTDTTQFQMALDRVQLFNTKFVFHNQQNGFYLRSHVRQGEFSLNTLGGHTYMDISADFEINDIRDGEIQWVKDKNLQSKLGFAIKDLDKYTIQDGELVVERMKFAINGSIDNSGHNLFTDITINSTYSRLEELLQLSPSLLAGSLSDYQVQGAAYFNAAIVGEWSASQSANINVGFGFRDGDIVQASTGIALHELNLDGRYSNGKRNNEYTSYIHLKGLRARHNTGEISGDFYLDNFNDPFCKFHIKANIGLAWLHGLFALPGIDQVQGELVSDLRFEGKLSNLEHMETLGNVEVTGEIGLSNIGIHAPALPKPIKGLSAKLTFEKPFLMVEGLRATVGASDLKLEGYFKNPLTFFKDKVLVLHGDLTCDTILLADFMPTTQPATAETPGNQATGNTVAGRIMANLHLDVGHLAYERFAVGHIKGKAMYQKGQLAVDDLEFNTLGGKVQVSGLLRSNTFSGHTLDMELALDQIDLSQLFWTFHDFDQDALTHEMIKGLIDAQPSLSLRLDHDFNPEVTSLTARVPITVVQGELIGFLPMVKLGGFIKVGQFEHLVFDTLISHLFIADNQIVIPSTEVSSNSFDMVVSGTHSLDNMVDYQLALNLGKLFMEQHRVDDNTFAHFAKAPSGKVMVYLLAKGHIDSLDIAYDMGALGGSIGKEVMWQKESIKEALAKERKLKEGRRDSLLQAYVKNQRVRRKNTLKGGWDQTIGP